MTWKSHVQSIEKFDTCDFFLTEEKFIQIFLRNMALNGTKKLRPGIFLANFMSSSICHLIHFYRANHISMYIFTPSYI